MTDKITESMTPTDLDPVAHGPLAGDWGDDDSAAYEEDFTAADHRPEKVTGVPHPVAELPVATRLLTRAVTVGTLNGLLQDPIMILPPDPHRKALTITSIASALASFRLGSEKSDCFNGQNFFTPNNVPMVLSLDGHTGAVWAYSADAVSAVTLSVAAVTQ